MFLIGSGARLEAFSRQQKSSSLGADFDASLVWKPVEKQQRQGWECSQLSELVGMSKEKVLPAVDALSRDVEEIAFVCLFLLWD